MFGITAMISYEKIRIDIHNLKELPPLAKSAREMLAAINDPDISLEKLCGILETEPSVTARLLKLANSAYFGCRGTITSMRQAVIQVLGLRLAKSLSLGVLITDVLDTHKCPDFSSDRYWFTAVAAAILAKQFCAVAPATKTVDPALAYTAGLLHNIGLLALIHKFPQIMAKVLKESIKSNCAVADVLQSTYKVDQYESGGWLAMRWQFPLPICVSIRYHRKPSYSGQYHSLVATIGIASKLANDLYREKELDRAIKDTAENLGISEAKVGTIFDELIGQLENIKVLADLLTGNHP